MQDAMGVYRAIWTRADQEADADAPKRDLMGEQEVMQFLQQVLNQPADEVRFYVDELLANGRVRVEHVEEDWYRRFSRAA